MIRENFSKKKLGDLAVDAWAQFMASTDGDSPVCGLCGFDRQEGEHGLYEFDGGRSVVVLCRPVAIVQHPLKRGVISAV